MIFFKRNNIVIDAFTTNQAIFEYFPIESSNKFYPSWWKDIPNSYIEPDHNGIMIDSSTIKRCRGLVDFYSVGFIIPMWSDLHIETREETDVFVWRYSGSSLPQLVTHPKSQYGNTFDKFKHIKIVTPWIMKENSGVNFHFGAPIWSSNNYLEGLNILPGVVNYKYQCSTNINIFAPHNKIYHIQHGTPIVHLVPLTDKNVNIKCHVITPQEYSKIETSKSYSMSFLNSYGIIKNKIDKKQVKKCPFGFGK